MIDPVVVWLTSICVAAVLVHGGLHKLRARVVFTATLRDYQLLPDGMTPLVGLMLPWLELSAAALLLLPQFRMPGTLLAGGLLALYTLAMAINIQRGRRYIDCGCAGPAQRQPISTWLILRNGLLVALLIPNLVGAAARPMVWVDYFTIAVGAAAMILLYGVGNGLAANQPRSLVIKHG